MGACLEFQIPRLMQYLMLAMSHRYCSANNSVLSPLQTHWWESPVDMFPIESTLDPSRLSHPTSLMTNRQELCVFGMLFQIFCMGSFHGEKGIIRMETRVFFFFFFQSIFHSGFSLKLNEKSPAYCQAEIRCRIHPKPEPGILIIVFLGLTDLKAFFSVFILK